MEVLGSNKDLYFHRDPTSFPTPPEYNDWDPILAQCQAPEDILYPSVEIPASDSLYTDCLSDQSLDLNVNLNRDLYLDPSFPTSAPIDTVCDPRQSEFVGNNDYHEPGLDCFMLPDHLTPTMPQNLSIPPFEVTEPGLSPLAIPTNPTTPDLCLSQNRALCIITATQSLRSLHIPQTNCLSRQNGSNGQDVPKPSRMSGSVLKCNKDAGMAVCSMLQCGCSLRPQNQLLLAIICSRLISWYRAMIRTCFLSSPSELGNNAPESDFVSPEKVVHQPVTIGDHSVDDQVLGWTIQAQVTLGELRHMQRLVGTLSLRIRETPNMQPNGSLGFAADTQVPLVGLPGPAHDRLVAHLMEEVHAAKADLVSGWVEV
ncbi:hypothetical protein PENANT_c013G05754 [Penicillium antarcticum]|uniref:Aflatoxin regulatory protein domain-containing protein n=1 Tax=Penicillium antarcticum TaxID=416450 RepID=A0A1V6Q5C7_9EURO|nr:uncharacterized protein N7508_004117 [Penicillium antarcticum]KAJ5308738.1 hypothetical protein N7508_004117 [Penicillium antarcticum]OQD84450.1 hypothetical protein PENANT_c013G05754 [Penicillium antarcticum]